MSHTQKQGTIVPVTLVSEEDRYAQIKIETATGISDLTRKWLIALGMLLDLRHYVLKVFLESKKAGYPAKDYDQELLEASRGVELVLNKYLADQIQMSMLDLGYDNIYKTGRI